MKNTPNRTQWLLRLAAFNLVMVGGIQASERSDTLQAINWVENPLNSPQAGPFGELGPYQFRKSTWRSYTKRPFTQALDRQSSDEVAVQHYEWIRRGLRGAGIEPIPFNIALAWNAGLERVLQGRAPDAAYDYASRVRGLVEMLKARELEKEKSAPARPQNTLAALAQANGVAIVLWSAQPKGITP